MDQRGLGTRTANINNGSTTLNIVGTGANINATTGTGAPYSYLDNAMVAGSHQLMHYQPALSYLPYSTHPHQEAPPGLVAEPGQIDLGTAHDLGGSMESAAAHRGVPLRPAAAHRVARVEDQAGEVLLPFAGSQSTIMGLHHPGISEFGSKCAGSSLLGGHHRLDHDGQHAAPGHQLRRSQLRLFGGGKEVLEGKKGGKLAKLTHEEVIKGKGKGKELLEMVRIKGGNNKDNFKDPAQCCKVTLSSAPATVVAAPHRQSSGKDLMELVLSKGARGNKGSTTGSTSTTIIPPLRSTNTTCGSVPPVVVPDYTSPDESSSAGAMIKGLVVQGGGASSMAHVAQQGASMALNLHHHQAKAYSVYGPSGDSPNARKVVLQDHSSPMPRMTVESSNDSYLTANYDPTTDPRVNPFPKFGMTEEEHALADEIDEMMDALADDTPVVGSVYDNTVHHPAGHQPRSIYDDINVDGGASGARLPAISGGGRGMVPPHHQIVAPPHPDVVAHLPPAAVQHVLVPPPVVPVAGVAHHSRVAHHHVIVPPTHVVVAPKGPPSIAAPGTSHHPAGTSSYHHQIPQPHLHHPGAGGGRVLDPAVPPGSTSIYDNCVFLIPPPPPESDDDSHSIPPPPPPEDSDEESYHDQYAGAGYQSVPPPLPSWQQDSHHGAGIVAEEDMIAESLRGKTSSSAGYPISFGYQELVAGINGGYDFPHAAAPHPSDHYYGHPHHDPPLVRKSSQVSSSSFNGSITPASSRDVHRERRSGAASSRAKVHAAKREQYAGPRPPGLDTVEGEAEDEADQENVYHAPHYRTGGADEDLYGYDEIFQIHTKGKGAPGGPTGATNAVPQVGRPDRGDVNNPAAGTTMTNGIANFKSVGSGWDAVATELADGNTTWAPGSPGPPAATAPQPVMTDDTSIRAKNVPPSMMASTNNKNAWNHGMNTITSMEETSAPESVPLESWCSSATEGERGGATTTTAPPPAAMTNKERNFWDRQRRKDKRKSTMAATQDGEDGSSSVTPRRTDNSAGAPVTVAPVSKILYLFWTTNG